MKIEIRATYAATDGRMPEDVSVEIDTEGVQDGADLTHGVIMPVLDRLIALPAARDLTMAWDGIKDALTTESPVPVYKRPEIPAEVLNEGCGRPGCGHRRYSHLDGEPDQAGLAFYLGRCMACSPGPDRCLGFIGSETVED